MFDEFSKNSIIKAIDTYFKPYIDVEKATIFFITQHNITKDCATIDTVIDSIASVVYDKFMLDVEFIAKKDVTYKSVDEVLKVKTISLVATLGYRIANEMYYAPYANDKEGIKLKARSFMQDILATTSIDIHPAAQIDTGFFIDHGANLVIGETCIIGKNCNLFNNVILGSKNVVANISAKRHPTLKDNVTVCAGAKILGDITLGSQVFVSPYALVLQDIASDHSVIITNQLQVTKNVDYSCLPSQRLNIYGVVPKYKNKLVIMGESFYNPTVLIKLKGSKPLNYNIAYWDKNKIMIKIKNTTPFDKDSVKNAKIIILSNSHKVVLQNSYGLTKALTSLCQ